MCQEGVRPASRADRRALAILAHLASKLNSAHWPRALSLDSQNSLDFQSLQSRISVPMVRQALPRGSARRASSNPSPCPMRGQAGLAPVARRLPVYAASVVRLVDRGPAVTSTSPPPSHALPDSDSRVRRGNSLLETVSCSHLALRSLSIQLVPSFKHESLP